jgi:hypothetical protein
MAVADDEMKVSDLPLDTNGIMTLQPSDYIAAGALLVALFSLWRSYRSGQDAKHIRAVEKRADCLLKQNESLMIASVAAMETYELLLRVKRLSATDIGKKAGAAELTTQLALLLEIFEDSKHGALERRTKLSEADVKGKDAVVLLENEAALLGESIIKVREAAALLEKFKEELTEFEALVEESEQSVTSESTP